MLLYLTEYLARSYSGFHVFQYLTLRGILAAMTALAMAMLIGPRMIAALSHYQIGQRVRTDGPQSHLQKSGTPTMGGGLILVAMVIATLLWADLSSRFVWVLVGTDARLRRHRLLRRLFEIGGRQFQGTPGALQISGAVGRRAVRGDQPVHYASIGRRDLAVRPILQDRGRAHVRRWVRRLRLLRHRRHQQRCESHRWPRRSRDHADRHGCRGARRLCLRHRQHQIRNLPADPVHRRRGRSARFSAAAMVGAGLGFLWFNSYPAEVFMGDVGALAIGAALGTVAVIVRQEIVLFVMGGVFVLETVSVMLQVASFKLTGKRIFRMAPLHHHFELKGWSEPKVIVRFWIISFMLVLAGLATLKIR